MQGYDAAGSTAAEAGAGGASGSGSASAGTDTTAANGMARDAVETVVKLAEAQATQTEAGSHSVSLGFKFGQERLAVRVEMSDGEVRTQFTTGSADLRAAISSEWQTFTASSSERTAHFADPVFNAPGGDAADSGTGGSASRQSFSPAWAGPGPAGSGDDSTDAAAPAPETASSAPLPTSRHLHTFA